MNVQDLLLPFEIELVPATGTYLIINGFPGFLPMKCSWAIDKNTDEFLFFDEHAERFFGRRYPHSGLSSIDSYIEYFLRWEFDEEIRTCARKSSFVFETHCSPNTKHILADRLLGAYTETLQMAYKDKIDKLFRLSEKYFPSTSSEGQATE